MEDTPELDPGRDWLAVVASETIDEFAQAFAMDPILEASVLTTPVVGVAAIRAFFQATRSMYERITFTRESRSERQTYLEWVGEYRGRRVVGTTILTGDAAGAIKRIRLFHLPFDQLVAFARDLDRRLISGCSESLDET